MSRKGVPDRLQIWIDARKKFQLSHAQVQMARELGLNPKKLGKLANQDQEPWKKPLPQFIGHLYRKRFRRDCPAVVMSIEEKAEMERRQKLARREKKRAESKEIGDDLMTGNPEENR
jgi:hypothetical protein